jgi:hypothetical protein
MRKDYERKMTEKQVSFYHTQGAYLDGSKDLTRRIHWRIKPGEVFMGVDKMQGIPKGGHRIRLGRSICHAIGMEPVDEIVRRPQRYDRAGVLRSEVVREGFPAFATEIVNITPDGKWDDELLTGDYGLILLDGNAGHPEYAYFTIRPGESAYIPLIGHAVSSEPGEVPTQTPTPEPTVTVLPTPTTTPEPTITTPVPTTVPTPEPTITILPTPVPTPEPCEVHYVWVCGNWGTFCWGKFCIPNPGHCTLVKQCIS